MLFYRLCASGGIGDDVAGHNMTSEDTFHNIIMFTGIASIQCTETISNGTTNLLYRSRGKFPLFHYILLTMGKSKGNEENCSDSLLYSTSSVFSIQQCLLKSSLKTTIFDSSFIFFYLHFLAF
jgi:hypothetical protein